ncbi:hypothetical protein BST81_20185 [Leptolyngbya sp. 'hensonii']|uniref:MBL fold metallo-hydrolase n=1 Tax=Leptolyngbya sp. 'hensonii' TaxID=1922337 RepID=UPI00094F8F34|nr:MBL fold metallo-hydrolase [Leptolyngbya sp. 'hensonii']OLP16522.1 hypothetical protein BST81_20185 [Leptolyngbya sp. 'hensonii']
MVELECLPYGVGEADEGICLLLRMGSHRILLDCGLRDIAPLEAASTPKGQIELVFCSHAHSDHARGLLAFHRAFPQVPICASEVTTQLLPLNWPEEAATELPFFTQALPWRTPVEFRDGLTVELWPAGHLPGAAAILLTYTPSELRGEARPRSYTVFYTGDFFLSNCRLVDGLPLEEIRGLKPDVLILEGTYGTARHPRRRQQENQVAERISRAISEKQSVLILAPFLGSGQELLMLLRSHHSFTGRNVDIWVDGTVATACDFYLDLLPHFPTAVQNFAQHQPLFWDDRVRPRVRRLILPEQYALIGQSPCIVLTDRTDRLELFYTSGNTPWLVLLPQYGRIAAPTLQSTLDKTRRWPDNRLGPESADLPPVAVETYLLTDHCDGPGTSQLIHNLRPQHVIFVHGASTYLADLTNLEELQNRYHLHCPAAGTPVELPIGETFLQPSAPEGNFEGELTESGPLVTITIPDAVTADPRWQKFADTGLIEVRWQGEELVLRGLSQWEILGQGSDRLLMQAENGIPTRDCCGICKHYRAQHCWNPASPLVNLRVPEDGFCPAFESRLG